MIMAMTELSAAPSQPELTISELLDRVGRVTRGLQFVDGLSPAQWEALRFLARANRYSRGPSALAEFLRTTKGTVSQTLIALENKGYIRRVRSKQDKRSVVLELTPAGDALLYRDPLLVVDEVVAGLSASEHEMISGGLSRLLHDVRQRLGGSEFGICEACSLFAAEAAAGEHDGPHRCGLTSDPVDHTESRRICVNYQASD